MELLPIEETEAENQDFMNHPDSQATIPVTIDFFNRIGYTPPWIGYYAQLNGKLVGSCAFKGAPKNGKVEIAYGTFPAYQKQGVAAEMCRQLVRLSLKTDPSVIITARTLPEESFSTKVLRKNGFKCLGIVWDEEDGDVWEWEFQPTD
ncbi:GNAT family N-acetyltransferase [Runella sp.]|uniref:GNAT family N-acetyltransferase n=1 Tax=Runella sp. TaxID=1960881 RepID=UPI003D0C1951